MNFFGRNFCLMKDSINERLITHFGKNFKRTDVNLAKKVIRILQELSYIVSALQNMLFLYKVVRIIGKYLAESYKICDFRKLGYQN